MKIGVNLMPLRPGGVGGAEVYVRDLLGELLRRGDHQYVLVTTDDNHASLPGDTAACRRIPFGRSARRGMRQRVTGRVRRWLRRAPPAPEPSLGELIRGERLDLWFCPFTNLEPRSIPVPTVITLHDLQHEFYPQFFAAEELAHRRAFYPESCAAASHVIAVSEFTRRCAMDRFGVEPGRISTVWHGVAGDVDWAGGRARATEVRRRYRLPERYAFYPANTWRHKNHVRLIEALARHRARHRDALALVLTGAGDNGQRELEAAVAAHGLGDAVRTLGFVPRADLPALYAGAACLVMPSLFEGFGIPLVEAMLAGCPIAAARTTSVPEIAGDAAVLFDPLDPADICAALEAVTGDAERAADLVRRGRARAPLFSVATMTSRTIEIFERARREPVPASGRATSVDGVGVV